MRHGVDVDPGTVLADPVGKHAEVSCYHRQRISCLGEGLRVVARAADRGTQAVDRPAAAGWFNAGQLHPEDTAREDPRQQALVDALVTAAR